MSAQGNLWPVLSRSILGFGTQALRSRKPTQWFSFHASHSMPPTPRLPLSTATTPLKTMFVSYAIIVAPAPLQTLQITIQSFAWAPFNSLSRCGLQSCFKCPLCRSNAFKTNQNHLGGFKRKNDGKRRSTKNNKNFAKIQF